MSTHLLSGGKKSKLQVGPHSERPGPTLLSVVATEVKQVTRSSQFSDIMSSERMKTNA